MFVHVYYFIILYAGMVARVYFCMSRYMRESVCLVIVNGILFCFVKVCLILHTCILHADCIHWSLSNRLEYVQSGNTWYTFVVIEGVVGVVVMCPFVFCLFV